MPTPHIAGCADVCVRFVLIVSWAPSPNIRCALIEVFHRRIGRVGYVAGLVLSSALALPYLWGAESTASSFSDDPKKFAVAGAYIFINFLLSTWRCHDFGKSGWHDFWNNQIPFIGGFISLFELIFKSGDPHMNSFGKPTWL